MGSGTLPTRTKNPNRKSTLLGADGAAVVRCRRVLDRMEIELIDGLEPPFVGEVMFDESENRLVILSGDVQAGVIADDREAELRICIAAGFRYVATVASLSPGRGLARVQQV